MSEDEDIFWMEADIKFHKERIPVIIASIIACTSMVGAMICATIADSIWIHAPTVAATIYFIAFFKPEIERYLATPKPSSFR